MNLSFPRTLSRRGDRTSRLLGPRVHLNPSAPPAARPGAPSIDGRRLGLSRVNRPLPSAALRILETTWRLWREPRPA